MPQPRDFMRVVLGGGGVVALLCAVLLARPDLLDRVTAPAIYLASGLVLLAAALVPPTLRMLRAAGAALRVLAAHHPRDGVFLAGVAFLALGCLCVYPPLALVVVGAALAAAAWLFMPPPAPPEAR